MCDANEPKPPLNRIEMAAHTFARILETLEKKPEGLYQVFFEVSSDGDVDFKISQVPAHLSRRLK